MGLLPLEFTDGLTDSPYFRETLQAHERELDRTNSAIKHLSKDIRDLVVAARNLSRAQRTLSETLNNFNFECIGNSQTDDEMVIANSFKDFARLLTTIEDERDRLLEKADEAFLEPIERFRREQIGSAKEAKKKFDKETTKYCQNLERYLNMSIKKGENQLQEADASYSIEQWHFFKAMSEYVLKLQEVNERKKFEFVETVLSFMIGWLTFYHQGHEIANDFYSVKMELQMRLQRTRNNFNMTQEETKCLRQKMLNNSDKKLNSRLWQDSGSYNKMYTRQGYLFLMEKKAFSTSWTKHFCQYQKGSHRLTMIQFTQTMGKILSTEEITIKECIRRNTDSIDRRFCFDIVTEISGHNSATPNGSTGYPSNASTGSADQCVVYTFQSLSEEDYKLWMDALDGRDPVASSAKSGKPNPSKSVDSGKISTDSGYGDSYDLDEEGHCFVKKCIHSIEAKGLDQKGIYRIVGVTSKVRNLMDMFMDKRNQSIARRKGSTSDSNSSADESDLFEMNLESEDFETKTITSALKSYLRNLAEPIMTFQLHQAFISAAKLENRAMRIDRIHLLVHRLPELNFKVLKSLVEHLQKVSKLHDKNLMTPSNLGVCFGPTLLRTAEESVAAILDIKFVNVIAELLIENYEKIFLTKPSLDESSLTKTSAKGTELSIQQRPLPHVPSMPYATFQYGLQPQSLGSKTANSIFFTHPYNRNANNLSPASVMRNISSQLSADGTYGQRQLFLPNQQTVRRSSSQDQLYSVIPAAMQRNRMFVSPQQNVPLSHIQHRHLGAFPGQLQHQSLLQQQPNASRKPISLTSSSSSPTPSSAIPQPGFLGQPNQAGHIYQAPLLLKNAPVTSTSSGIYGHIRGPLLQPSVSYQNLHYNSEIAAATNEMNLAAHPNLAYTRPMTSIGILPLTNALSGINLEQTKVVGNAPTLPPSQIQQPQSLNLTHVSRPTSNPSSLQPRQFNLSSTSSASLPSTPEHSQQTSQFPYSTRPVVSVQGQPMKPSLSPQPPSVVDGPYEQTLYPQQQSQQQSLYGTIGHQAQHPPLVSNQPQQSQQALPSTKVRTRYVCIGGNDSELSFQPNMVITNVRSSREPGWLEGNLNGKTGLVPLNYVEFIE